MTNLTLRSKIITLMLILCFSTNIRPILCFSTNIHPNVEKIIDKLIFHELFDAPGFCMEKVGKILGLVKNIPEKQLHKIRGKIQEITKTSDPNKIKPFYSSLPSWLMFPTEKRFFIDTNHLEQLAQEEKDFYICQEAHQVLSKHFLKTGILTDIAEAAALSLALSTLTILTYGDGTYSIKKISSGFLTALAIDHLVALYWRTLNKTADIKTTKALGEHGAMSYLKNHVHRDEKDFLIKIGKIFFPTWFWRHASAEERIGNIAQELNLI